MDYDIQTTIQDNIRLKKALQMSKFNSDKLQKQLHNIQSLYSQEIQKNRTLKNDYCELQRKYQLSFTQSVKDNNSLISQIEELKQIIDQKQRDMEQIQIKLIPSLDQDMLRVKLITQMEGPYQQTVDQKDKQIEKLKNKVTELERTLQLTTLDCKSKISYLKRQSQELKTKYEEETNKLMQELNISLSRYEVNSVEASIVKNQKKQILQLKSTIEFINQNQEKLTQEIKELKHERTTLLEKLMAFNSKEAILLQGKHNLTEIQKLKEERINQIKLIQLAKTQKDKMTRQINKLEQDKTKLINQHEKQLTVERSKFTHQKNQLNSEIHSLREELRLLKNYKIQGQSDREATLEKIKSLEKELYLKTRQIETLKLESSRISHQRQTENNVWHRTEIEKRFISHTEEKKENNQTIINKRKVVNQDYEEKNDKRVQELRKENEKLKKKLAEANEKIMELIRGKMKYNMGNSPQRDRTQSNIDKPIGVFLEYEDCAFTPLVEPTLYTYKNTSKIH